MLLSFALMPTFISVTQAIRSNFQFLHRVLYRCPLRRCMYSSLQ
jgi:hypothetical protein